MLNIYLAIYGLQILNTGRYFDEISRDTGRYCFLVDDTLRALEIGAVEVLICWENLDVVRHVLKKPGAETIDSTKKIVHTTANQRYNNSDFIDKEVISYLFILLFCIFSLYYVCWFVL